MMWLAIKFLIHFKLDLDDEKIKVGICFTYKLEVASLSIVYLSLFNHFNQTATIEISYYVYIFAIKVITFEPFYTAITSALFYRLVHQGLIILLNPQVRCNIILTKFIKTLRRIGIFYQILRSDMRTPLQVIKTST